MLRAVAVFAGVLVLAGCATNDTVEPPAELTRFESSLPLERMWRAKVGGDADLRNALAPAIDGDRVFIAGADGSVQSLGLEDGARRWRVTSGVRLSAGPGVGRDLVVVGGNDGDVIAFEASTGAERWRRRVSTEVLASPVIAGQVVLVRTTDERVHALDAADGGTLWTHEQTMPSLVLRGSAGLAVVDSMAVTGYDNGRVNALQVRDGVVVWETPVASPTGRTEIERMVDVDSTPRVIGRDVYAVSYQGRLVAMAVESGRVLWTQDASSSAGLNADGERVYVTDADSEVRAFDRLTGARGWVQATMRARSLTAPALLPGALAVGDFEGYVHVLARDSGELVARVRVGKGPIHTMPAVSGPWLVVQNADGSVAAYRVGAD